MPLAIPVALAPYLESSLASYHNQILITSTLSTPPPWLLLRLVYSALYGVGDDGESRNIAAAGAQGGGPSRPVVFVSLLRPLSLWMEMGKKMVSDYSGGRQPIPM